jgi:hypothetical protein
LLKSSFKWLLFSIALNAAVVSCSNNPEDGEARTVEDGIRWQESVLESGQVDKSDYVEAFQRFTNCALERGVLIIELGADYETRRKVMYLSKPIGMDGDDWMAEMDAAVAVCGTAFLEQIETRYVSNAPRKMDEEFQFSLVDCLEKAQMRPAHSESYEEVIESVQGGDARIIDNCVANAKSHAEDKRLVVAYAKIIEDEDIAQYFSKEELNEMERFIK